MSNFRTELFVKPNSTKIDLKSKILTVGSCFSNSIGDQLLNSKFNCLINPFGVVFNPISILKLLQLAADDKKPSPDSFFHKDGHWKNYDFHSCFSAQSKLEIEEKIQEVLKRTHNFLKTCNYIIITFGTALVYRRNDNRETVANCHKQQASLFQRQLLTSAQICSSFSTAFDSLKKINPQIKIMITVSPVRHTKDTLELNSVSKSVLRFVSHELEQQFRAEYFPAYEIMMDDLRDYRFYEADMIHPNQQAIFYIWQKFSDQYFSDSTKDFIEKWKKIKTALNHRPFEPQAHSYQSFLQQTLASLMKLKHIVDIEKELVLIENQLSLIANAARKPQ